MIHGFSTGRRGTVVGSFAAVVFAAVQAFAAPPRALMVDENFTDPVGLHGGTPTFSWKLPEGVTKQTAYDIHATSGRKTWDSGWITSDRSTFVSYAGDPLTSRQQVEWRVRFRDEKGAESEWSAPAHFELGLLSKGDWSAKWIRPQGRPDPQKESAAGLRRSFSVGKKIARARLYVTARGLFEISLNNARIGNDHFANGFTAYDKRLDTLTYDVTPLLRSGDNTISALLGTGWYAGRYPFATKKKGAYGDHASLLAQLEITYEDGASEIIPSDEKWEGTFTTPIVSSSIYDGEEFDARRQAADWSPVIAEGDLGAAVLMPKPFAAVRETNALAVRQITQPQPGHYIFDLGQNMVGWARIRIPVEQGKTTTLHFAEMLKADGTLYTENLRSAKATDSYTAATTGAIEWEPHFTFHGFRYVELTGLPENAAPQKEWVTGIVLHSDLPPTGTFTSSNDELNQLQSNIVWGWRGNSVDIPTDCPQRDERLGWTGDAEVFCATSMFNTDALAFWKSWLGSMREEQHPDGVIPDVIPTAKTNSLAKSPGWMDAAAIIPWSVYVRSGDTSVLGDNFQMMEQLVGWYRSQSAGGLVPKIEGYGDWLQPYQQSRPVKGDWKSDRFGDTPRPLLGTAFYARSAQILADAARALGRTDDAARYDDEAAGVRAAFTKEYFDANGKLRSASETQTAYVLAIAFDLLPADLKPKAGANLVRLVHEAGDHLRTGFLGTPFLAPALDQTGHADLAAALLFQDTYPSWFYPINQGATTMWERWNSYTKDKGFGPVDMNSFNHYAYGAIGQWMYERVAGLAPDPAFPGYKHFFIRPLFVPQLTSAGATLETPYGKASSSWKKSGDAIALEVVVPPNTTATLELPGQDPQTVHAGSYHLKSIR